MFKKLLDILKSELKCPICLDQFNEPTITTCGHSFCNSCIQQTIDTGNGQCPLCKRAMLKTNIISNKKLQDIQDQVREMKDSENVNTQYKEMMQHSLFKIQDEPQLDISHRESLTDGREIVILTTALNWQVEDDFEKFVMKFGCKVPSQYSNNVSHLIVGFDDKKQAIRSTSSKKFKKSNIFETKRTVKFLQALIQGKWIISYKWIVHSLIAKKLLNEEDFEITSDGHAIGIPQRSRLEGGMVRLFKSYNFSFLVTQKRTDPKGIQISELQWMIENCGGEISEKPRNGINSLKICIIDKTFDMSFNKENLVSHKWILDSISQFKVLDRDFYKL